jgi:hypothetical protein
MSFFWSTYLVRNNVITNFVFLKDGIYADFWEYNYDYKTRLLS